MQTAKREQPPDAELPTTCRFPFLHSMYISICLPRPPPLLHPCPCVRQGSIFTSAKSTTPGQTHKKNEGEGEMWEERRRQTVARCHSTREKLPRIDKDKRGAIRSFCLVTFIVSPVLMAKKAPAHSLATPLRHTQVPGGPSVTQTYTLYIKHP